MYFYKNNPVGYPERIEVEALESYQLFNLQHDPSERFDLSSLHPEIMQEIEAMVARHRSTVKAAETQLEKRIVKK